MAFTTARSIIGAPKTHSAGADKHRRCLRGSNSGVAAANPACEQLTALSGDTAHGRIKCCRRGAGAGRGDRRYRPSRGPPEDRPTLRTWAVVSIPPSQAASAGPNHEARCDAFTVRSDRRRQVGARVGHADDGLDQTGGAELPPRGARDRDAADAVAAPRPPAKTVLNSPRSCRGGRPRCALRSLVREVV